MLVEILDIEFLDTSSRIWDYMDVHFIIHSDNQAAISALAKATVATSILTSP